MKALVPVNDRSYLRKYVQAGAEEFYMGFFDPAWHERFGDETDLNRMTGFRRQANPYCFEDVLDIVDEVLDLGKKAYVTFNANLYTRNQLDYLFGYFERLHAAGATGVIVSVPEAVGPAVDVGLEAVASTMCGVYNADIARFYRHAGCSRVIVPRDATLADIEALVQAEPGLQLEVFLMRNGCIFADGLCLGRHMQGRNALCWDVRHAERTLCAPRDICVPDQAVCENTRAYDALHLSACGLCAIWRLVHAGVSAAKIVGRSDDAAFVLRDIKAVVRNVEIALECADEREYLERMVVPPERRGDCADSLSCYYPEVRFPDADCGLRLA